LYFLNFFNEWWGCCLPPLLGVSPWCRCQDHMICGSMRCYFVAHISPLAMLFYSNPCCHVFDFSWNSLFLFWMEPLVQPWDWFFGFLKLLVIKHVWFEIRFGSISIITNLYLFILQ
jgi:hypothetical protein